MVPFARQLVDEHIKKLTDYAINEARKAKGRKEKIPYEAIQERFGTKLTNENGFGKLFEEALQKREGITSVTLNASGVDIVLKPEQQAAEKEKIAGIIQAYPSLTEYIKEMARLVDLYAAQAVDCQIDGKWTIRFSDVERQFNIRRRTGTWIFMRSSERLSKTGLTGMSVPTTGGTSGARGENPDMGCTTAHWARRI